MWKILARRRRAKIFHILKKKTRLRAESGEATTFEKPWMVSYDVLWARDVYLKLKVF